MKKYRDDLTDTRGSLPPQLLAGIPRDQIADATRAFVTSVNALGADFHCQLADRHMTPIARIADIKLTVPRLLGRDTKIEYVASGAQGSVYKLTIGDKPFALKINRQPYFITSELDNMHLTRRARNVFNRSYIGSRFEYDREKYTWILMDWVGGNRANSFELAREKLFYANLTKGLVYGDARADNIKDGRVIDMGGLYKHEMKLSRAEIDTVKKMVYAMKTESWDKFIAMIDTASQRTPAIIEYLFFYMNMMRFETPARFEKYRDIVSAYYRMLPVKADEHKRRGLFR
ncbi:MAG TPA: hypothetical protein DEA31_03370 [Alphaproteobacteria bacterium]|nr:hypothetical protein [Alphaproteobacteria bacterium]